MHRQATGKATLSPVARTKCGKTFWAARGTIPVRQADGSTGSRRVERGFGPDAQTASERHAKCAQWNQEYEERFRNPRKLITFARAYMNYIGTDHPVPLKADEILLELGEMQCTDIDNTIMVDLADEIWPEGAEPSTANRHLYSPVIAILRLALKERAPQLARPDGHNTVKPVTVPPLDWYRQLAPKLNPSQLAFLLFMAMHGRRTREALGRRPADLDVAAGIIDLGDTKTGVRQLVLHPNALGLITAIPDWQKRKWLFGAGPNSANSFRRDLRAACGRASLPWYSPHKFGRHASVTRMLRAGYSVAHVADAHGMTPEMVTKRYGHLTMRETTAAMHKVGGDLFDTVFNGGNAGEAAEIASTGFAPSPLLLLAKSGAQPRPELLPSEGDTLSS
jgi:integrase